MLARASLFLVAVAGPLRAQSYNFSSNDLSLTLTATGRVSSLVDQVTRTERIRVVPAYYQPLCQVVVGGVTQAPTSLARAGNLLTFKFGNLTPVPEVTLSIEELGAYLRIRIAALTNDSAIEQIRFVNLDTDGSVDGLVYRFLRYPDVRRDRYVAIMPLDIYTRTQVGPGSAGSYLWATAYPDLPAVTPVSMIGRGVALFACDVDQASVYQVVGQVEAQNAIPLGVAARWQPMLDRSGIFWVHAPYARRNDVLQYTLNAGAAKMLLLAYVWANPRDEYRPPSDWPSAAAMHDWVEQCRAAGLAVGAHVYPSIIPHDSGPHIRAGCDPRIRRVATLQLAAPMESRQTSGLIETTTPPLGWPTDVTSLVAIDGEIIGYSDIKVDQPPYGLMGPLTRAYRQGGAGGLGPREHAAGASVELLKTIDEGGYYEWDIRSGGLQHWCEVIASAMDAIGFDFVYLDNLEDCEGPDWFTRSLQNYYMWSMPTRKPLWIESSSAAGAFQWSMVAVGAQMDYWFPYGFRHEVERNVDRLSWTVFRYDKKQLGWPRPSHSSVEVTTPDEFEYLMARSLAYDAPVFLEVWWDWMQVWPNRDANLATMKRYEQLRLAHYFDDTSLAIARVPYQDVMLFDDPQSGPHLEVVSEAPIANGTPALRGFVANQQINGRHYVTLWPTALNDQRNLYLPNVPAADVQVVDWQGSPVPVSQVTDATRVPVQSRIYLRLSNVADPVELMRVSRLTASTTPCPGDLNFDRRVTEADLGIVLAWFQFGPGGDLDGDGDTDESDIAVILSNWGAVCP